MSQLDIVLMEYVKVVNEQYKWKNNIKKYIDVLSDIKIITYKSSC